MKKINIKHFVTSYLATAAWETVESGECADFTKDAKKVAEKDCNWFIDAVASELGEDEAVRLLTIPGSDLTYLAPQCFFLNRNGHGTGFWDREIEFGETNAALLSQISKQAGRCDCYHIAGKKSKLTFN